MKSNIRIKICGDFACFTRPEMKVERVSYEVMTPSAARGILEAIYWKPQIRWIIDKIYVLNDINFTSIMRNEVSSKASPKSVMFIEEKRQQRSSRILKNVAYVIDAHIEIVANSSEIITKHLEIFKRRIMKGQCFHQPYLGCREFPASFEPFDENNTISAINVTTDLGLMLHDIEHKNEKMTPYFFNANLDKGMMHIPSWKHREKNLKHVTNNEHAVKTTALAALCDYYKLKEKTTDYMPIPGFGHENVSFIVEITKNGKLKSIHSNHDDRQKPKRMMVPIIKRTNKPEPKFLADNIEYAFGISSSKTTTEKHSLFVNLNNSLLKNTENPSLKAFKLFLSSFVLDNLYDVCKKSNIEKQDFIDSKGSIVFKIENDLLHNLPEAKQIWSNYSLDKNSIKKDNITCLITGKQGIVSKLHPPIKGVSGALSTGANIISFNQDSFTSYGMIQGENSPISPYAAHEYTAALNHLIRYNKVVIGDTTILCWAQSSGSIQNKLFEICGITSPLEDDQTTEDKDQSKKLKKLLIQTKKGIFPENKIQEILNDNNLSSDTPCYILGIKQNRARLFVSFWLPMNLKKFFEASKQHSDDLRLEPIPNNIDKTPSIQRLLKQALNSKSKIDNIPSSLTSSIMHAILTGGRYPYSLLYMLLGRIRADQNVSWYRVLLIRAYIVRSERFNKTNLNKHININSNTDYMLMLDETESNVGYRLGRLFAILEKIQKDAINPGASITTKYFTSASSTPSKTFPTLVRTAHHHMSTLAKNKNKNGIVIWYDKMLTDIFGGLETSMPKILNIVNQGRFAIGYYHQKQSLYTKKDKTIKPTNDAQNSDE